MGVIFAILLFSFLIFIHEFGHYTAAKLSGVRVNEFSMFMGPAIFKKQRGETLYSIRCIPIGGYCAMEGEDGNSDDPRSFACAKWWKRLAILLAGSFMNLLAGLLLISLTLIPVKQFVVPQITAAESGCTVVREDGIHVGDWIVRIDGEAIYESSDFTMLLTIQPGDTHDITVKRDGKLIRFRDYVLETHEFDNGDGTTSQRYGFSFGVEDATFLNKTKYVFQNAANNIRLVRLSLKMLFTGQAGIQDLSGPVGIIKVMSDTAQQSDTALNALLNMIYFGGFIAINLAVMNLLPIPALDGGRAVCLLLTTAVEAITGKKIDPKFETALHSVGMILLLAFMAIIMFKDIFFIFKG